MPNPTNQNNPDNRILGRIYQSVISNTPNSLYDLQLTLSNDCFGNISKYLNCGIGTAGATPLILASQRGNDKIVRYLLGQHSEDIDINQATVTDHETAFIFACKLKKIGIIEMMLNDRRLNVMHRNSKGDCALDIIIDKIFKIDDSSNKQDVQDYFKILSLLLEDERTELNDILSKHKADLDSIIASKDVSRFKSLFLPANNVITSVDDIFIETDQNHWSSFFKQCADGNLEALKHIKDKDINETSHYYESTAIMIAAIHGHIELATELLKNPNIDLNKRNIFGSSALLNAIYSGNIEMTSLLLSDKRTKAIDFSNIKECCILAIALIHACVVQQKASVLFDLISIHASTKKEELNSSNDSIAGRKKGLKG